jgi:hypothetical protein
MHHDTFSRGFSHGYPSTAARFDFQQEEDGFFPFSK